MVKFKYSIVFSLLLFLSSPGISQVTCDTDAAQELDFLIGDWELFNNNGDVIGENSVKLVFGTCTIEEDFKGTNGLKTHSIFSYDAGTKRWKQNWTDNYGNTLNFTGVFKNGKLTLNATSTNSKGKKIHHRILYNKKSDGKVEQLWQKKSVNQKEWKTTYKGKYKPKKAVL